MVALEIRCDGRKTAEFKVEPIVNLPFPVKEK